MIVVDVETTGLDPKKNSILSIGAIDFNKPESVFYVECQMREGSEIQSDIDPYTNQPTDRSALLVNGFTLAQICDSSKPTLKQALELFFLWATSCENVTLAGHNVWFDRDFLRESARLYELSWAFGSRILDLHSLCYFDFLRRALSPPLHNNKTNITSDDVFKYVGLPEEPKPHHGLTGAKMEAEAFSRLLYGKNLLPEFSQFPIPDYLQKKKD